MRNQPAVHWPFHGQMAAVFLPSSQLAQLTLPKLTRATDGKERKERVKIRGPKGGQREKRR